MERTRTLRTEPVTTRLTRAERAVVEAAAVAMNKTRSSAVRDLLVSAARDRVARATTETAGG